MNRDELALLALLKQVYRDGGALQRALAHAFPDHSHLVVDEVNWDGSKAEVFYRATRQLSAGGFTRMEGLYQRVSSDGPGWRDEVWSVARRFRGVVDAPVLETPTVELPGDPSGGFEGGGGLKGGGVSPGGMGPQVDIDRLDPTPPLPPPRPPPSILDPEFDWAAPGVWSRADVRALHEAFSMGWPTLDAASALAVSARVRAQVPDVLAADPWRVILPQAGKAGRLDDLIDRAVQDDDPDRQRINTRLVPFLAQDRPMVPAPQEAPELMNAELEAQVTAENNLRPIWFLERARARSRSICQVRVRGPQGAVKGTGFVIGPHRVLTNHHVLLGGGVPEHVDVWFDFEEAAEGQPGAPKVLRGDVATVRASGFMGPGLDLAERVDWATIDTAEPIPADNPPLRLARGRRILVGRRCYIVHHPGGGEKQVTLQGNHVRFAGDQVLQYVTHTEKGSSGAPVFDEDWNVVAVHYAGGTLADPMTGRNEHRNMGVWVDAILDDPAFPGATP